MNEELTNNLLGFLALDVGRHGLAKVLALGSGNRQFLFGGLTRTIGAGDSASAISRTTNNFRVVKEVLKRFKSIVLSLLSDKTLTG